MVYLYCVSWCLFNLGLRSKKNRKKRRSREAKKQRKEERQKSKKHRSKTVEKKRSKEKNRGKLSLLGLTINALLGWLIPVTLRCHETWLENLGQLEDFPASHGFFCQRCIR